MRVARGAAAFALPGPGSHLWQTVLVRGGFGIHRLGRTSYPIRTGDVFVLNEHARHSYAETRGLDLLAVVFDYRHLRMGQWKTRRLEGFQALFHSRRQSQRGGEARFRFDPPVHFGQTVALVEEMERCMTYRFPSAEMLVDGHFKHLVIKLARGYEDRMREHDEAFVRMAEVVTFLDRNHRQPVDMLKMAAGMGLSERTFYRLFKRATGMTPVRYLMWRRIQCASDLLRNTERPVTQIAFESGFSDSNYFTREFRKLNGEPPSAFRRRWAD